MSEQNAVTDKVPQNIGKRNQPTFLDDNPIEDEGKSSFGVHNRIAKAMYEEIETSSNPSGLALIGKWGSGKSTVLNLLKKSLSNSESNYCYFLFDAWAHAGDSLRKTFLLSLGNQLHHCGLIDEADWEEKKSRIEGTQKLETTIQQSEFSPFTAFMIAFAFSYAVSFGITSGLSLFPDSFLPEFLVPFLSALLAFLFSLGIAGTLFWRRRKANEKEEYKKRKAQTFSDKIYELLSYLTGRPSMTSSSRIDTLAELDTIEFQKEFKSLLLSTKSHRDTRIVIAIDNLDRLAPEDIKKAWDTIQIFSGFSFESNIRPWIILPYSPDFSSLSYRGAIDYSAQGTFSKLFIKQFELPEPITTDWKNCFTGYLNTAFPSIGLEENLRVFSIVNTLDFGCINRTPREAIRFINEMVSQKKIYPEISLISIAIFCGIKSKYKMKEHSESFVSFLMPFLSGEEEWADRQISDLHCNREDCLNEISMMAFGVFTRESANEVYVKFIIENTIKTEGSVSFDTLVPGRPGSWAVVYECLRSALHRSENGNHWLAPTLQNLDSYDPKTNEEAYWKNLILLLLVSNLDLCSWPPYENCWNVVSFAIESDTFSRKDANRLYSHILKSVSAHIKETITEYDKKDCAAFSIWIKESSKIFLAIERKGFLPERIKLPAFNHSYGILVKEANYLDEDLAWLSRTIESSPESYFSALSAIADLIDFEGPLDINWKVISHFPALTSPTYGEDNFSVKAFFAPKNDQGRVDPSISNGSLFSFGDSNSVFSHFTAAWSILRFGKIQSDRTEEFIRSIEIPQAQHTPFLEYLLNVGSIWQIAVIDYVLEREENQWSIALLAELDSLAESLDFTDLGNDYRKIYGESTPSKLMKCSASKNKEKLSEILFVKSWRSEDSAIQKNSVLEFWLNLNQNTADREDLGNQIAQHGREKDISESSFKPHLASFYIGICNKTKGEEFLNWIHLCLNSLPSDVWNNDIASLQPRLIPLTITIYEPKLRPFPELLIDAIKQSIVAGDYGIIKRHGLLGYFDISAVQDVLLAHFIPPSSRWKELLMEIGTDLTEAEWFSKLNASDSLTVIKAIMRVGSKCHMDWLVKNLVEPGKAKTQLHGKLGETRSFLDSGIPRSIAQKRIVSKTCETILEAIKK